MTTNNRLRLPLLLIALFIFIAAPTRAQSPNTATMIVAVVDQAGAVVKGAKVLIVNNATGAEREAVSGSDGDATIPALSLTGTYTVSVSREGFGAQELKDVTLRSGETATLKVKLLVGSEKAEVIVYGAAEGVRADPQIGRRLDGRQIDETPILGRKVTILPLLNSAFRQAKGTGDLFVNATYFVTGVGGRRQTTVLLDGANNDEGWGRQTAIATVPIGAIQEITALSNAFSSEFGWTAGPALNIVTKSGTNSLHGEGLFMIRPGDWQAEKFSTKNFCPPSVPSCVTPTTLAAINPVDIPDALQQVSGSIGGPIIMDKTFFFATADYTRQDRTTFLSTALPAFLLPADGSLDYTGHYRQFLFDGRLDHKLTSRQTLMARLNIDRFYDDNPQDAVGGTSAPSVARRYTRRSVTGQLNHTMVINANLLNEARFAYLDGDPVTLWEAQNLSTTYTRGGAVPFTIGQSRASDLWGHQAQFADTLSWSRGKHYLRLGGSVIRHTSGGTGSEPGTAILGTFTFVSTGARGALPFDQLTLGDVQNYTQPIDFGINRYELSQWLLTGFVQDSIHLRRDLTVDAGIRYDRQTLTDATKDFAPRLGFGWRPGGSSRLSIRGGYGMYYTQIRSNAVAGYLVNGLDGLTTYTATPTGTGFPTCLTCVPVNVDPKMIPTNQLPARDITIRAGLRDFYRAQFARYGLNFDLLPNYPDKLVNPRSHVATIGAETEAIRGLFVGADYVHQHLTGIDRTVDLNAPSPLDRTSVGQCRPLPVGVAPCNNAANVNAANLTRPIFPANGRVRQVNVLTNLGVADYDGLQTQVSYRGNRKIYAAISYTLSKATNNSEPDGNGVNPNDGNFSRQGEFERGPSLLDQRHRAVITFSYLLPFNITAGTLTQLASARPFNATTGVDNNGDGANNDRPVINGTVIGKSTFRGTATSDVAVFIESRIKTSERTSILLRLEGFNIFNHGNYLGRGITTYGDTGTPLPTFGQLASVGTATNALPAFANVDPPRMFQVQARFTF
ncbi:MAG TPA: TonB-dependent receptor [Blastocatellia bacterium]|nr:TonB-dependent receptor [Blastocatellia bacterium]